VECRCWVDGNHDAVLALVLDPMGFHLLFSIVIAIGRRGKMG
jgi:hypothetical protein